MKFEKALQFCAAMALLFCSISGFAAAPHFFTLYLTTNADNRYGANITINVGQTSLQDLPESLLPLSPNSQEPVEVVIVVPKKASLEMRQEFLSQIRQQMTHRYPQARYNLRESFVDTEEDKAVLEEQQLQLEHLRQALPVGSEASALAEKIEKTIEAGLRENQKFEASWFEKSINSLNNTHPYNTVIAARVVAITKFATSGFVLIGKYGFNPVSALIGGISGGISAAFGYNAKRWSEFCTSHQFPWFKDSAPVRWYNNTGWFKSASINLIRSLGVSFMLRELAFMTHQSVHGRPVSSPNNLEFFIAGVGLTIPEIVLDGLMDDGARALELKGVLNHQSRSYLLWTVGLIDTTMHALFRAGAVKSAYAVATLSWGSKLALWGMSKVLTKKPKRFIFISDQVGRVPTGELIENKDNFFRYLWGLGKSLVQSVSNRRRGQFSVSDRDMVVQQFGLSEAWNLALPPEAMDRLENDPALTEEDFIKMLNLKDSDRGVVNSLWQSRQQRLNNRESSSLQDGRTYLMNACAAALAG